MLGKSQTLSSRWPRGLANALVNQLPTETIISILGSEGEALPNKQSPRNTKASQVKLLSLARADEAWRHRIVHAWRTAHREVVEAAHGVAMERSPSQAAAFVDHFGPQQVLLELITSPDEDGWWLAEWVIDALPLDGPRERMQRVLDELSNDAEDGPKLLRETATNLVIFGGHPRDETKISRRLFDDSSFRVRWRPCDKGAPDEKFIQDAMESADAAILVTSMVSHNVMLAVRQVADKRSIPFRTVGKATESQLRRVLNELFPATQ